MPTNNQILFEMFSAHVEIRNTYHTCGYGRILIIVSLENKIALTHLWRIMHIHK